MKRFQLILVLLLLTTAQQSPIDAAEGKSGGWNSIISLFQKHSMTAGVMALATGVGLRLYGNTDVIKSRIAPILMAMSLPLFATAAYHKRQEELDRIEREEKKTPVQQGQTKTGQIREQLEKERKALEEQQRAIEQKKQAQQLLKDQYDAEQKRRDETKRLLDEKARLNKEKLRLEDEKISEAEQKIFDELKEALKQAQKAREERAKAEAKAREGGAPKPHQPSYDAETQKKLNALFFNFQFLPAGDLKTWREALKDLKMQALVQEWILQNPDAIYAIHNAIQDSELNKLNTNEAKVERLLIIKSIAAMRFYVPSRGNPQRFVLKPDTDQFDIDQAYKTSLPYFRNQKDWNNNYNAWLEAGVLARNQLRKSEYMNTLRELYNKSIAGNEPDKNKIIDLSKISLEAFSMEDRKVLGLEGRNEITMKSLTSAYRKRIIIVHPDRAKKTKEDEEMANMMAKRLNIAFGRFKALVVASQSRSSSSYIEESELKDIAEVTPLEEGVLTGLRVPVVTYLVGATGGKREE